LKDYFLNRKEAILVVKELLDKCAFLDGKYLSVVSPTSIEPPTAYYQIHIRANLDSLTEACMREILDNHDLSMQAFKSEELAIISKCNP
jgi:hypothetical protein